MASHTQPLPAPSASPVPLHRARYRRVVRFFAGVILHFIVWELLLRRVLGRTYVGRSFERRWRRIARRFRELAVELGGVLIKLGQFLSVRVDVLPRAVTDELSGLQDEVPAEPTSAVLAVVEAEYGRPVEQLFAWFAPLPEAAASLAQVHRARLPGGDEVVVKVQRPHIEALVETDLRSIRTAWRWLKRYGPIRRRVDMDRLYDEFSRTTRNELDFLAEGHNAERFALNFAQDAGVRIPRSYTGLSTRRVLILENVASLKITDRVALQAAGIDPKEVARRLFDTYMQQLFVDNFLHADPHPGNLFVEPLPRAEVEGGCPFRLVFVDFGMVATVPERLRTHLRDWLVGFATRDGARMVRAYQGAGVLLPGADLVRLEQIEAEMLERYSGLTLRQAQQVAMSEWHNLAEEYRELLYEMPFQLPTDLLFVGRAMAILFGLATSLDPDFDPWAAIEPFAKGLATAEGKRDWRMVLDELQRLTRLALSLPGQVDRFFAQAGRGELTVRTSWTPEAARSLRRVELAVSRLAGAVVFAALLLAAVAVYVTRGAGPLSTTLFALAAVALLVTMARRR